MRTTGTPRNHDDRPRGSNGHGASSSASSPGEPRRGVDPRWAGDEDLASHRRHERGDDERSRPTPDYGYERAGGGYQSGEGGWSRHGAYEHQDTPERRHHTGDHWTDRGRYLGGNADQGYHYGPRPDWQGGHPRDYQGEEGYYQGRSDYRGGDYYGGGDDERRQAEWSRRGEWGEPYGDSFGGYGDGWGGWQQSGREGQRLDRGPGDDDRQIHERGRHAGKGPRGWRRSDERIAEDINERLTAHDDVDAEDIEVKVEACEVTLTGTVDSRRTKRLAEDLALDVRGVRDVHNQLRVRPPDRKT